MAPTLFLLTLVLSLLSTTYAASHRRCGAHLNAVKNAVSKPSDAPQAKPNALATTGNGNGGCFPSLGFKMPAGPPGSTDGWWCSQQSEHAFLGFSYEVTPCQSRSQLTKEFKDIRNTFHGRYVRLYGTCDRQGFYNDVVEAAWDAGVGVHALVWFGFTGGNAWQGRRDRLVDTLYSNPKAKFVTRVVQFGSEPMFDNVLGTGALADQVHQLRGKLSSLGIPVTVSEMAYGFQKNGGASNVMSAINFIDAHMLPFFSTRASTGGAAWPIVQTDIDWFVKNGQGKKIIFSQNGWPSTQYDGVRPNSRAAVSNVQNSQAYYDMLNAHCEDLKRLGPQGGIGWFAHLYSDYMEPGYGIYGNNGQLKFPFQPRTSC